MPRARRWQGQAPPGNLLHPIWEPVTTGDPSDRAFVAMEMSGPRRKPGRLGRFVDGYRVRLLELGYTPQTVRGMLKVLGQLGRWMATEGSSRGEWTWPGSRRSWLRDGLVAIAGWRAWVSCASWWRICVRLGRWCPQPARESALAERGQGASRGSAAAARRCRRGARLYLSRRASHTSRRRCAGE